MSRRSSLVLAIGLACAALSAARAPAVHAQGYPNGYDAGELHQLPPYFSLGEAIVGYFQKRP